jgi:hypothetical protein
VEEDAMVEGSKKMRSNVRYYFTYYSFKFN